MERERSRDSVGKIDGDKRRNARIRTWARGGRSPKSSTGKGHGRSRERRTITVRGRKRKTRMKRRNGGEGRGRRRSSEEKRNPSNVCHLERRVHRGTVMIKRLINFRLATMRPYTRTIIMECPPRLQLALLR